jgi:hypothetical protein
MYCVNCCKVPDPFIGDRVEAGPRPSTRQQALSVSQAAQLVQHNHVEVIMWMEAGCLQEGACIARFIQCVCTHDLSACEYVFACVCVCLCVCLIMTLL